MWGRAPKATFGRLVPEQPCVIFPRFLSFSESKGGAKSAAPTGPHTLPQPQGGSAQARRDGATVLVSDPPSLRPILLRRGRSSRLQYTHTFVGRSIGPVLVIYLVASEENIMMSDTHRRPILLLTVLVFFTTGLETRSSLAQQPSLIHSFPAAAPPIDLTPGGNTIYFLGYDPVHRYELWRTDGHPDGTHMVADIAPNQTENAYLPQLWDNMDVLFSHHGKVYMSVYTLAFGYEPWVSDGTPGGTVMLKDIHPGYSDSYPQLFTEHQGWIYFIASDITGYQLFRTDGTPGGTTALFPIPNSLGNPPSCLVSTGDALFFDTAANMAGNQLWVSDGTEAGTQAIKQFASDGGSFEPACSSFSAINAKLYFSASTTSAGPKSAMAGNQPWTSDGTAWGTTVLKNTASKQSGSNPKGFVSHAGKIYFSAQSAAGRELWKTGGTAGTTWLVKDLFPGDASSNPGGSLMPQSAPKPCANYDSPTQGAEFYSFGKHLYFAATLPNRGTELVSTDGTAAGTSMVKDLYPGQGSSNPRSFVASGEFLYFVADTKALSSALFRTDGTHSGTYQISQSLMILDHLEVSGNRIFMVAACTDSSCGDPGTVGIWTLCTGCDVAGTCVGPGTVNPSTPCEICSPAVASTSWTKADGLYCVQETPCSIAFGTCQDHQCVVLGDSSPACPFEVHTCSPTATEPGSYRTLTVYGTGFSPTTTLTLQQGVMLSQTFVSSTKMAAEVLAPMEPGSYAVTATTPNPDGDQVSVLPNAVTVVNTFKPGLQGGSCTADADCVEGDPCTQEVCHTNQCLSFLRPECCPTPAACDVCQAGMDLTGDGIVTDDDIQCGIDTIVWHVGKKVEPYPGCMASPLFMADTNCDNVMNIMDMLVLITKAAGDLGSFDTNGNGCVDSCEP